MKKIVLSLLAAVCCSTAGLAQSGLRPRIEVGLNAANVKVSDAENLGSYQTRLGLRAAFALEAKLFSGVYIAPGLAYRQNYTKVSPTSSGGFSGYFKTQSLNLPLNLGLRVKPGGIVGISIEAGPYLTYALRSSITGSDGVSALVDANKYIDFNRFGYGLGASAAAEFSKFYIRLGVESDLYSRWHNTDQRKTEFRARDYNAYLAVGLLF